MSAWALLLGMAFIMLGNGLQGTLLGLRATLEGFPTTVTGFVMTGYFVGFLLGSTIAPKIVAKVGHIRVFAALASLASVSALVHAILVDPYSWGAMRVVTGFAYAGLYVVAESWLNDRATNKNRGQILSIYDAPSPVGLRQLYTISPLGVAGGLANGLSNGVIFGMGAVYANARGMSNAEISLFMGLVLLGGMLLQWPVGRISDLLDRRKVIIGVTALAAFLALIAGSFPDMPLWSLLVLTFLLGGMSLPMYSLCGSHLNDFLEPKQMVAASSAYVLVSGLGAILGPTSASLAMHLAGPEGFFLLLGLVNCFIALFALWRMTRRASMSLEDQGTFVSMPPRGSPVAATLNPETPENAADWAEIPADFDPMK
jgi:MFS family permease